MSSSSLYHKEWNRRTIIIWTERPGQHK